LDARKLDNQEDTMYGSKLVTALLGVCGLAMLVGGLVMLSQRKPNLPRAHYRVHLDDAAKNYRQTKGTAERLLKSDNVYIVQRGG
jgi:hypothetical protein